MNFDPNIKAHLVYDGGANYFVPDELKPEVGGKPIDNDEFWKLIRQQKQLHGNATECVCELAGRTCYDRLGKAGRNSQQYWEHIRQVKHLSVCEHVHFTVEIPIQGVEYLMKALMVLANRRGVWVARPFSKMSALRITINPRALLEWGQWTARNDARGHENDAKDLGGVLYNIIAPKVPLLLPPKLSPSHGVLVNEDFVRVVEPEDNNERFITLYLSGSRGFSHEQVRHRMEMSQRCLAGDTLATFVELDKKAGLYRRIKGKVPRTMRHLHEMWLRSNFRDRVRAMKIRVLDEATQRFTTSNVKNVLHSGLKQCFRVELDDGKEITCTEDHRIYTNSGWKTLREIAQPQIRTTGTVFWNKETTIKLACNGIVTQEPVAVDSEWLRQAYRVEKRTIRDIAAQVGVPPALIQQNIRHFGLRFPGKGAANVGRPSWNKAAALRRTYAQRGWLEDRYRNKGMTLSRIAAEGECSISAIRKWLRRHSLQKKMDEINLGRVPWNKGKSYNQKKPYSPETIEKYRQSKMGSKNPRWKGGVLPEARRLFHQWKKQYGKDVFERDHYRCRLCNKTASEVIAKHRKRKLEIHHIYPIWARPDLATSIDNMVLMCLDCHVGYNGRELERADELLSRLSVPIERQVVTKQRVWAGNVLKPKYVGIKAITDAGVIDTYDLEVEGLNHGFVANGVVVHNSTRFCDEDESPWIEHPLITLWREEKGKEPRGLAVVDKARSNDFEAKLAARRVYSATVDELQDFLLKRGVDKITARKQARGAARGYLGNALFTELLFTASVNDWLGILSQRLNGAADAEIRVLASQMLTELGSSRRYGQAFKDLRTEPAPDGIGEALV